MDFSWIFKGQATLSESPTAALLSKLGMTDLLKVAEFVIPRMLKAVEYLSSRDIDNDGLLEQNHDEDGMDTVLRAGKIVYSQACWNFRHKNSYCRYHREN